jgi:hypothetical protein
VPKYAKNVHIRATGMTHGKRTKYSFNGKHAIIMSHAHATIICLEIKILQIGPCEICSYFLKREWMRDLEAFT